MGHSSYRALWFQLTLKTWSLYNDPSTIQGWWGDVAWGESVVGRAILPGDSTIVYCHIAIETSNVPLHFKMKVAPNLDVESVSPWMSSYDPRKKAMRWSQSSIIIFVGGMGFPWKIPQQRCFHICHVARPASMVHNDFRYVDFVGDQDGELVILIVPRSNCMKGPNSLNWGNHDSWFLVSHWAAAHETSP